MTSDSLQHLLDSVRQSNLKLHIIDSVKISLQVVNTEKSWLEKYGILVTGIFALIVLISTIIANRKQMKKDNMIKFRKEWLNETSKLIAEIHELLRY